MIFARKRRDNGSKNKSRKKEGAMIMGALGRKVRSARFWIAAVSLFLITGTSAHAVPIRTLPGLVAVVVWEASGGETLFNMLPNDTVIKEKRADRLSAGNRDFQSNANEFYDFFYSDADGTFNVDGAFLTVTAIFDGAPDSGLNVTRAALNLVGGLEFASFVSSFVALGTTPLPATRFNALGNNPATTTFLGDTAGQPDSVRLSLTLGFETTRPPISMTEPGTLAIFGLGLAGLYVVRRRRMT